MYIVLKGSKDGCDTLWHTAAYNKGGLSWGTIVQAIFNGYDEAKEFAKAESNRWGCKTVICHVSALVEPPEKVMPPPVKVYTGTAAIKPLMK